MESEAVRSLLLAKSSDYFHFKPPISRHKFSLLIFPHFRDK